MRTVKTELKIYSFDELKDPARQKAIDGVIHFNRETWDHDPVLEGFYEKTNKLRLQGVEFYYTLNYSQGDGACMDFSLDTGISIADTFIDFCKEIDYEIPSEILNGLNKQYIFIKIETIKNYYATHYCHENTRDFDIIGTTPQNITDSELEQITDNYGDFIKSFEEKLRVWYNSFCKELYNTLDKDYMYQTSEKTAVENIRESELEFLEDGTVFYPDEHNIVE